MSTGDINYDRINDYGAVRISLASPHDIRSWSFGEVKKPETINYRTYRPEKDGLFCERIFGPEKDWECACGKYRGMKYKGMICDRCGVKVTHSRVRRKRMGHIELAAPVVHIWFFKAMPSRLGTLLDMKTTSLEKIIYFQDYVVIDAGRHAAQEAPAPDRGRVPQGPRELRRHLRGRDGRRGRQEAARRPQPRRSVARAAREARRSRARRTSRPSRSSATSSSGSRWSKRCATRGLGGPQNKAEWMVLECIPVIPPDLRPLVLLDSGNFATSDLNDLYRRIINRNNRLKKLVDLNAPEVIIRNEKRMLQQSVDALFDNNRCKRPVLGSQQPPAQVADRHDQGQAGPLPREPARQARRLLGPLGHRRRPRAAAAPVRSAQEDRPGAVPAVHHPPAQGAGPRRHHQVGQEDARTQGRRRSGTSWKRSSRTIRCCSTGRRRCTAWASRRSSRC